jgi:hypothetical protein
MWERLDQLLRDDPNARTFYILYMNEHAALLWRYRDEPITDLGMSESVGISTRLDAPAAFALPRVALVHNTLGLLASGWPMAYLIATVIVGLGIAIASTVCVSDPAHIAIHWQRVSEQQQTINEKAELVGRITGMVDCKWDASNENAVRGGGVSLGHTYTLASGLLEITYDTGAKVILQGPVSYEVESKNSGFMSIGKLTGKVETEIAKGFAIRTPTATIIDLGTEFGVEVAKDGCTTSHVFRGKIKVSPIVVGGKVAASARVLNANESVEVGNDGTIKVRPVASSHDATRFVRGIPVVRKRFLDLVDVVAGGNGFSGRRNAGIDPSNGQLCTETPKISERQGDNKYHRVQGMPFVDGVFIPDGRSGPVQVNSAGHTIADFSSSSNMTSHLVWAGGIVPIPKDNLHMSKFPTVLDGIDYASSGHGLLAMHANKGITFDLDAIRRANPGCTVRRFLAVAGNVEDASENKGLPVFADYWVIIDGRVHVCTREINHYNGGLPVNVGIKDKDRFLTLVATDSRNGVEFDWILFGDPRLELLSDEPTERDLPKEKHP